MPPFPHMPFPHQWMSTRSELPSYPALLVLPQKTTLPPLSHQPKSIEIQVHTLLLLLLLYQGPLPSISIHFWISFEVSSSSSST